MRTNDAKGPATRQIDLMFSNMETSKFYSMTLPGLTSEDRFWKDLDFHAAKIKIRPTDMGMASLYMIHHDLELYDAQN